MERPRGQLSSLSLFFGILLFWFHIPFFPSYAFPLALIDPIARLRVCLERLQDKEALLNPSKPFHDPAWDAKNNKSDEQHELSLSRRTPEMNKLRQDLWFKSVSLSEQVSRMTFVPFLKAASLDDLQRYPVLDSFHLVLPSSFFLGISTPRSRQSKLILSARLWPVWFLSSITGPQMSKSRQCEPCSGTSSSGNFIAWATHLYYSIFFFDCVFPFPFLC